MKQYLDLVREVLTEGSWQENRTGIRTKSIPGAMLKFDLQKGFPAVTTKKLAFKTAIGELVGFLRGSRSAADFRALGCKVWDQNANENKDWLANPFRLDVDSIGQVYGFQWRSWPAYKVIDLSQPKADAQVQAAVAKGFTMLGTIEEVTEEGKTTSAVLYKAIDQLRQCLETIVKDPGNRRILFHGWNNAQLDEMALPPCHLLYQFLCNQANNELSLCVYIRSNDIGLGQPFNVCEAAALLELVSRLTGKVAKYCTIFVADAHIYENHIPMLEEQLTREPYPLPSLKLSDRIPDYAKTGVFQPEWLDKVEPSDFVLEGYQHHAPLTAPMAV